jgi:hypothetical protein
MTPKWAVLEEKQGFRPIKMTRLQMLFHFFAGRVFASHCGKATSGARSDYKKNCPKTYHRFLPFSAMCENPFMSIVPARGRWGNAAQILPSAAAWMSACVASSRTMEKAQMFQRKSLVFPMVAVISNLNRFWRRGGEWPAAGRKTQKFETLVACAKADLRPNCLTDAILSSS